MSDESTLIDTTAQGSTEAGTGQQDGAKAADTTSAGGAGGQGAQGEQSTTAAGEDGTLLTEGEKPPADGKTAEGEKAKDGEGEKTEGAPAEYAEFTAPDGVTLDGEVLGSLKSVAKELNLSQAQAQKIADLGVQLQQRSAQAQTEAVARARTEWASQSKADKEFGGEKLSEHLAVASKALDQFGTPELRTMLRTTGLGNHPEVIRFMVRAGKAISEDTVVNGQRNSGPISAKDLYPLSNMN